MAGVSTALLFTRNLPDGMKRMKLAAFLTWGGLKGGLCLALIMGTNNVLSSQIYNLFLVSTYAIVLFTTVFQGLTVGKAYKMLNNKKEFRLADKSLKKPLFATADRADRWFPKWIFTTNKHKRAINNRPYEPEQAYDFKKTSM